MIQQANSVRGAGVASLDTAPEHGNLARRHHHPSKDPDRYLQLRQAEFTARRLGAALRCMREARGLTREAACKEIGMSKGTLESMEVGDPMVGAAMWRAAWTWMGLADAVHAAACAGADSWGDAVRARRGLAGNQGRRRGVSQSALANSLRCSRSTVEEIERCSMLVRIHHWINVWRWMGIEAAVVEAADPMLKIRAEDAEAAASREVEVPPALD